MNTLLIRYGVWAAIIGAILSVLVEVAEIIDAGPVFTSAFWAILRAIDS